MTGDVPSKRVCMADNGQGSTQPFNSYKPIGALPLMKCCFSHSLLQLRRILGAMGGGGGWIEKRGECSMSYGITEI